ncbi:MAG: lysylphosphatidylglycerol synthase domain-containing protein [Gemmatimonadota bacterium]|nr:lysylphosphatidylglycerol synthase domain-containing protein [Gemmatimonadota bacterium]
MPSGSLRRWLRWVERVAAALVVVFLAVYLVRNWGRVSAYEWSVGWPRVLLASGGLILVYSGFVLLWRHVLGALGGRLSTVDAHRVWYFANLGRYVPGKILQLAGAAWMARAKGVSPVVTVAATVTGQAFVVGTGFVIVALSLPEAPGGWFEVGWAGVALAAVLLTILLTPAFDGTYRLALRLLRRPELYRKIPWNERIALTAGYGLLWIGLGVAFFLFLDGVVGLPARAVWPVVGIYAAAHLAGYLMVFVPGGLGVREGVFAVLLGLYVPATIAVAGSILARLWSTAVELLVAAALAVGYGVEDLRAGAESGNPSEAREAHG